MTDLSQYVPGVHFTGYECSPVKLLRELKGAMYMPGDPTVEFWTKSNTNFAKVTCRFCFFDVGYRVEGEAEYKAKLLADYKPLP